MKKLFGIRIGPPKEIVASLPILDVLRNSIGETYNIFVLGKKYYYFYEFLLEHPLINEIKISDYEENIGPKDFEKITECDYFINPTPPNLKEKDWYNHRSLIEEIALSATVNFKLINTNPILYNLNIRNNDIKYDVGIFKGDTYGPSERWWENFFKKADFNFIEINKISGFCDQVKTALSCKVLVSPPSDLSWTTAAFQKNYQLNLISKYRPDHKSNIESLAPRNNKTKNIINTDSFDGIEIEETIEIVNNYLYNNL